jgi:hypothetical protein
MAIVAVEISKKQGSHYHDYKNFNKCLAGIRNNNNGQAR